MIETERLKIYPVSDDEMRALIGRESDPELKKAYSEMLAGCESEPDKREWYAAWYIGLRESGTVVGDLCFKGFGEAVEIGYGLREGFCGNGYMTEALRAVTAWALEQKGVRTVEAETAPDNAASQRVLMNAGFAPTGGFGEEGPRFVYGGSGTVRDIYGANYSGFTDKYRSACRGIILRDGSVLLSHERAVGQYMIPGGGIEEGETPAQCCVREIAEETGVAAEAGKCFLLMNEYYEEWCFTTYFFECRAVGNCERRPTERERQVCAEPEWVPLTEALDIFSRHADYDGINEERRGIYLREYTALKEFTVINLAL